MNQTETLTVTERKPQRPSTRTLYNHHQLNEFKSRLDELRREWENRQQPFLIGGKPPTPVRAWLWNGLAGSLFLLSLSTLHLAGSAGIVFLPLGGTLLASLAALHCTSRLIQYRRLERVYRQRRQTIRIEDCPILPKVPFQKACL